MVIPKRKEGLYSPLTDGVLRSHIEHRYAVAVFAGFHRVELFRHPPPPFPAVSSASMWMTAGKKRCGQ